MQLRHRSLAPVIAVPMLAVVAALAGPLDPPPGPIAPTYKTLTEVEPRVALSAANTPGDANSIYRITRTGSYYLADHLFGQPGKHGIEIAANGVTIDLNGFDVVGGAGSSTGIRVDFAGLSDITILNGSVRAWGGGGVELLFQEPTGCRVEGVRASGNTFSGIRVQSGVVVSCTATENRAGIVLMHGTMTGCQATGNTDNGIELGWGCSATGCSASENGGVGIYLNGTGDTLADSAACFNGGNGIAVSWNGVVRGCSSASNGGSGIVGYGSTSVMDCIVVGNTYHGISANGRSMIINNLALGDSPDPNGAVAAIRVNGHGSRIEGNNCGWSPIGIHVPDAGNIIVRNTCGDNATDWVLGANNVHGPIIDRRAVASPAVNGFAAPSSLGVVDANANFSY